MSSSTAYSIYWNRFILAHRGYPQIETAGWAPAVRSPRFRTNWLLVHGFGHTQFRWREPGAAMAVLTRCVYQIGVLTANRQENRLRDANYDALASLIARSGQAVTQSPHERQASAFGV